MPPASRTLGVNTLSITSDAESTPVLIVSDFYFDTAGHGMAEGISDHLTVDAIDFVLECWGKLLWLTLDNHANGWSMPARLKLNERERAQKRGTRYSFRYTPRIEDYEELLSHREDWRARVSRAYFNPL